MTREEFLKAKIKEKWSIREFARLVGIPSSTMHSILQNVGGASIHNIFKICEPLDISVDDLKIDEDVEGVPTVKVAQDKLLSFSSSVGVYPYYNTDNLEESEILIHNDALGDYARDVNVFFICLKSSEMDELFPQNSIFAVKKGYPVDLLRNGELVALKTDKGYNIRRFYLDNRTNSLVFSPQSKSPEFAPIVLGLEGVNAIAGKVIACTVILV